MVSMANTDFIPALAADLKGYEGTPLAGGRPAAYGAVATAAEALSKARATPRRFLAAARSLSARARARRARNPRPPRRALRVADPLARPDFQREAWSTRAGHGGRAIVHCNVLPCCLPPARALSCIPHAGRSFWVSLQPAGQHAQGACG